MALKGKFVIFGNVILTNALAKLVPNSIKGGKPGGWEAQVVVYPDASLHEAVEAAAKVQATACAATFKTGVALSKVADDDAKLVEAFEAAKAAEHAADAKLAEAVRARDAVPPASQGTVTAPYDANVARPYVLLYAAVKAQAQFKDMTDA